MRDAETLLAQVRERFGPLVLDSRIDCQQVTMDIAYGELLTVCRALRDEEAFAFAQLSDLCGVDYATWGQSDWQTQRSTDTGFSRGRAVMVAGAHPQLAVVYHLLSLRHNRRLRLRVHVQDEPPRIASVVEIWNSADWYERECFDLFGILFEGHPDLRRLLTDYGFIGYPMRKDFPLQGQVEVRYDPDKRRVVYQPVSIQNRVLVPRVIRDDNRYINTGGDLGGESRNA